MSSAVANLPVSQKPMVVSDDRAGFGALRAELHERCQDQDLAELWDDMTNGERKAVLASARLDTKDSVVSIERMPKSDRNSIRGAIRRMSSYAARLRERLETAEPVACQLARNAREAILEGNQQSALHWLSLIEKGAA